jgi:hypothetical protein
MECMNQVVTAYDVVVSGKANTMYQGTEAIFHTTTILEESVYLYAPSALSSVPESTASIR